MLKVKHQLYCDEYIKTGNATQSYMKIYKIKNEHTATVSSSRLMKRPDIKAYIEEQQDKLAAKGIWDAESIIKDLKEIATNKNNNNTARLRAYQLGGQAIGMFKTEIKHSGSIDSNLTHLSDEELDKIIEEDDE